MSKKNAIKCRLAIAVGVIMLAFVLVFAEYGVAAWFDIHYQGMTYIDYVRHVHQTFPAYYVSATVGFVIIVAGTTEMIYRFLVALKRKLEDR